MKLTTPRSCLSWEAGVMGGEVVAAIARLYRPMTERNVTFRGRVVTVDGNAWEAPYPVAAAIRAGDLVVLLYDYMSGPKYHFRNLEGFTVTGDRLWTAEHPTTMSNDVYVEIATTEPLVASTFTAYRCTLDPTTGRIVEMEFSK